MDLVASKRDSFDSDDDDDVREGGRECARDRQTGRQTETDKDKDRERGGARERLGGISMPDSFDSSEDDDVISGEDDDVISGEDDDVISVPCF